MPRCMLQEALVDGLNKQRIGVGWQFVEVKQQREGGRGRPDAQGEEGEECVCLRLADVCGTGGRKKRSSITLYYGNARARASEGAGLATPECTQRTTIAAADPDTQK